MGDVDADLFDAVCVGDSQRVLALIEKGVTATGTVPNGGFTLAHFAVHADDPRTIIAALVRGSVNLDMGDDGGCTPLLLATSEGNLVAMSALLDAGAGPNIADHRGVTPIAVAQQARNLDAIRLLTRHVPPPHAEGCASLALAMFLMPVAIGLLATAGKGR